MNATSVGKQRLLSYSLNLVNIILDVLASMLTHHYDAGYSTFEICFVCFGFAYVAIATIVETRHAVARARGHGRPAWTALPRQFARVWCAMALGVVLVTYFPRRWATMPSPRCHWPGGLRWGQLCPCSWCRLLNPLWAFGP